MIRYHKKSNTYITSKNSYFDKDILISGNLISGLNTTFWGNVLVEGSAHLGRNTKICGNLTAESVILSSSSSIKGNITSSGNVLVLPGSKAGSVVCDGTLTIMDNSLVGFARSYELIEIIGNPKILELDRITKTVVRKDSLLPIPPEEDWEENVSEAESDDSRYDYGGSESVSDDKIYSKNNLNLSLK